MLRSCEGRPPPAAAPLVRMAAESSCGSACRPDRIGSKATCIAGAWCRGCGQRIISEACNMQCQPRMQLDHYASGRS